MQGPSALFNSSLLVAVVAAASAAAAVVVVVVVWPYLCCLDLAGVFEMNETMNSLHKKKKNDLYII